MPGSISFLGQVLVLPHCGLFVVCTHIMDSFRYNHPDTNKAGEMLKCEVKRALLTLLISILEGLRNPDIALQILAAMDFHAVEVQILDLCRTQGWMETKKKRFSDDDMYTPLGHGGTQSVNGFLLEELTLLCIFVLKVNACVSTTGAAAVLPWLQVCGHLVRNVRRHLKSDEPQRYEGGVFKPPDSCCLVNADFGL